MARLRGLVLDSVTSDQSRRSYAHGIDSFLVWVRDTNPGTGFTKATVYAYRSHLLEKGLAPSSINLRLTSIRRLAEEAGDNGLIPHEIANGIGRVKGVRQDGRRLGNWLTPQQCADLIRLPDVGTLKGKRDRALLGLMLGSGLRREEVASLLVSHLQMREARWLLVDVRGKGLKLRSVPIPAFVKAGIDVWIEAAGIQEGRLFRPIHKGGKVSGASMTAQAVFSTVKKYAVKLGFPNLAPHDLRRTFAKMAYQEKAPIDQIQMSLGHSTILTTERYLGTQQNLLDAPCDYLKIPL